jgi:NAD(P)-dependent dehydrogenase (short-subunit alcohol dehydrogenase family)
MVCRSRRGKLKENSMSNTRWTADRIGDQTGRPVVVTGATSGIGKEAARVLAGKNAAVVIAAHNVEKAQTTIAEISADFPNAVVSCRELDLSSLKSIQAFAEAYAADFDRLDVLINNAGVMIPPYSKTEDGFEIQLGTNHLGHFALTGHLLPLLKKTPGSRVVVVSSMAHRSGKLDFSDLNWEARPYKTGTAYGDSKIANLHFGYALADKLKNSGGTPMIVAAHPGWSSTELMRHSNIVTLMSKIFAQPGEMGALPTLRTGFDDDAVAGDYFGPANLFGMRGYPVKVTSNARSRDAQIGAQLWRQS